MEFPASPTPSGDIQAVWPLVLFVLLTVGTFVGMMVASWFAGERRPRAGQAPYESGFPPTGSARIRFAPQFYLVGMLFVIFDVEAAFLFAWAVAVRELGWAGFAEAAFFIVVLGVSLAWLWRVGALDWGLTTRRVRHEPPTRQIPHPTQPGTPVGAAEGT